MNFDISEIPQSLQRGFKRNKTIQSFIDFIDYEIENLPKEQMNYIFSRDLDVLTKALKKYGFKEFAQKIRNYKTFHKKCPNCDLIYKVKKKSSKFQCPVCKEYNEIQNKHRIDKIVQTSSENNSYETRGQKISRTLKSKSPEEWAIIRQQAVNTTKGRYGEDFWGKKTKEMWDSRDESERQIIGQRISQTKLNWSGSQRESFKQRIKLKWSQKTPEELRNIQKKADETSIGKYGFTKRFNTPEVKEQIKQTNIKKYGVSNPILNPIIKSKMKNTMLQKYGVENILQNPDYSQKVKEKLLKRTQEEKRGSLLKSQNTNLLKYGVEHFTQKNIKNYENYNNKAFWDSTFCQVIKGNRYFDYTQISTYFGISYTQVYNKLKTFFDKFSIMSKSNTLEVKFLNSLNNSNIIRQYRILNFRVDGYDTKTNIVYEFLGDYWHGKRNNEEENHLGETFKSLYEKTFERFEKIVREGYTLHYIWESDFLENGLSGIKEYTL